MAFRSSFVNADSRFVVAASLRSRSAASFRPFNRVDLIAMGKPSTSTKFSLSFEQHLDLGAVDANALLRSIDGSREVVRIGGCHRF